MTARLYADGEMVFEGTTSRAAIWKKASAVAGREGRTIDFELLAFGGSPETEKRTIHPDVRTRDGL